MPELPEVETIVRGLQKKVSGTTITSIKIHDGRVVRQATYAAFSRKLTGRSIKQVSRRGKAIIIDLGPGQGFLVVQLMMTGQMIVSSDSAPQRDTKVTFQLSNKTSLHYNDYRTFGRLQVVASLDEIPYFKALGPEPLEKYFTVPWLTQELKKKKTPIKPLLLNHQFVAGIGNIYASEILFASGIDPRRPAATLQKEEIVLLHQETKKILRQAIRSRGTSMNTYRDTEGEKGNFINRIKVYGREKEQCLSCSSALVREFQAGRSTFYCPRCQK